MSHLQRVQEKGGEDNYIIDEKTGELVSIGRGFSLKDSFDGLEGQGLSGTIMHQIFNHKVDLDQYTSGDSTKPPNVKPTDESFDVSRVSIEQMVDQTTKKMIQKQPTPATTTKQPELSEIE